MEEQIKKTAARVRTTFAYFWMLPILLVLLGETGGEWVGMYAGDVRATYMAETITILLAASCVPVSLKLFSWVLIRKIDVVIGLTASLFCLPGEGRLRKELHINKEEM